MGAEQIEGGEDKVVDGASSLEYPRRTRAICEAREGAEELQRHRWFP